MSAFENIDSGKTTAVLIGSSKFDKDPELFDHISVERNIIKLQELLKDVSIVGCQVIISLNEGLVDTKEKLREACEQNCQTLIVYYAGHGIRDTDKGNLYLATTDSKYDNPEDNSISASDFCSTIKKSKASRKILIIDCCKSGRMAEDGLGIALSSSLETVTGCLFTATAPNRNAKANSDLGYTAFTGALIKILEEGINNNNEFIKTEELFTQITSEVNNWNIDRNDDDKIPIPQLIPFNKGGQIIFSRNKKYFKVKGRTLSGIVEILHECHDLLKRTTTAGSSIWFAGLSSAFGPVHNIEILQEKWQDEYKDEVAFSRMSKDFNNNLLGILAKAGVRAQIIVVTLEDKLIKPKFIDPLYATGEYAIEKKENQHLLDIVLEKVRKFERKIIEQAAINKNIVKCVEEMPYQAIVTQQIIRGDKTIQGVIIQVGTANIGKDIPKGFFINDEVECYKQIRYIENLYQSGKKKSINENKIGLAKKP